MESPTTFLNANRIISACGASWHAEPISKRLIPQVHECLTPIIATIPSQLLTHHIAVMKGRDVDMPRTPAKSVSVE